jgi:hypothetical protein
MCMVNSTQVKKLHHLSFQWKRVHGHAGYLNFKIYSKSLNYCFYKKIRKNVLSLELNDDANKQVAIFQEEASQKLFLPF